MSSKKGLSAGDQESLKRMGNSVHLVDGHYEVAMLWKSDNPWLPDNRQMAEARLQYLKRKLKRDKNLHKKFRDFIDCLVSKGYAWKLSAEEVNRRGGKT